MPENAANPEIAKVDAEMGSARRRVIMYRLNSAASLSQFDTGYSDQMYRVSLEEHHFQVSGVIFGLLNYLRSPRSLTELRHHIAAGELDFPAVLDLKKVLEGVLVHRGFVVRLHEGVPVPPKVPVAPLKPRQSPLLIGVPLLSQRAIQPVTSRLQRLFEGERVRVALPAIAVLHALYYWREHVLRHTLHLHMSFQDWAITIAMVYGALLVHEFGHASACTRYGVAHGEIGFGIYITWPVFYANVTECWGLSRRQRVIVDAAGIYFHLLFNAACCLVWLVTGWGPLRVVVHSVILGTYANLNPFLKFDGYWFLADLTGIPSLHKSSGELWKYWFEKYLLRKSEARRPAVLSSRRAVRMATVIYAVLYGAFLVVAITWLIRFLPRLAERLPKNIRTLEGLLRTHNLGWAFTKLLFASAMLIYGGYRGVRMMYRRLSQLFRGLRDLLWPERAKRRSNNRKSKGGLEYDLL